MQRKSTTCLFAIACAAGGLLPAQCATTWRPGLVAPGINSPNNAVRAIAWWDPDGSGPRGQVLVFGGAFAIPSVGACNLAIYDPATGAFAALPDQPNSHVFAIAVLANGDLVVGGSFTAIGAQSASRLARWDGTSWSGLGAGVANATGGALIETLLASPNGELWVGGQFTTAGGAPASGLARWDGSQWHGFAGFDGAVHCLDRRPNGSVLVGGSFQAPGSTLRVNLAEWDGANWSTFGNALTGPNIRVESVFVLPNGNMFAAGVFTLLGNEPHNNIARWDGTSWSASPGFLGRPQAFAALPNGDVLAASVIVIPAGTIFGVVRWDGTQWTEYARRIGEVHAMTMSPSGELLVAGNLAVLDDEPVRGLARWDGTRWNALGHGFDDDVRGLIELPTGELVAYGAFRYAPYQPTTALVRWDGAAWRPMPASVNAGSWFNAPDCAALDRLGDLWLGGALPASTTANAILRWNGGGWDELAAPFRVSCMAFVGGDLHAGCPYATSLGRSIRRHDGIQWFDLGAGLDGPVRALLAHGPGELIAAGEFLCSGALPLPRVARWDGTAWHPLGDGFDGPVLALAELPNGDVIAAGRFYRDGLGMQSLDLVARWDGATWHSLGSGLGGPLAAQVNALLVLPDGDLLVAGEFDHAGGVPLANIARWDGASWSAVGGGIDGPVLALAQLADGTVVAGGRFQSAGGRLSSHFARLGTSCPAGATALGIGCAGAAGPLTLEAAALPWTGGSYRATCYGVSPSAIAIELLGLQSPQLPLSTLHPAALPGCMLRASADAALLRLPHQGAIASQFALADDPVFAGLVLFHQVLAGEFAGGQLTALASSNGLRLTIGTF
jgi:hypothetical protein